MSDGENWDGAAESLLDELWDFCSSDSLSEEGLRDIIERHGLTPNNLNLSNYEFFREACVNLSVNEGIIRFLLEYFPDAAGYTPEFIPTQDDFPTTSTPLHVACSNKNATLGIIQLLIDAAPESVRSVNDLGCMPLHSLCRNSDIDENGAIEILRLLLEKCQESIRHADIFGMIPLHEAAMATSPEFCRILIEAYPGSERIGSNQGYLPLHAACLTGTRHNIEYLFNLYPDAIIHRAGQQYPIHIAIRRLDACDIVKFLLDCDSSVILQKYRAMSLLHYACEESNMVYESNTDVLIKVIETLYDADPEAIEGDELISNIQRYHQQVQEFLNGELVHARQANDHRLMTTPDENGQLPLHRALQNNVRLGSIKQLVRGNPSALRTFDSNGVIPLHLACQYHESLSVIRYLLELDTTTLRYVDFDGNTALHYACRAGKYDTITMLLDEYGATSVSNLNADGMLPIDLLFESDRVEDRASIEYLDCVFRLLKVNPFMRE